MVTQEGATLDAALPISVAPAYSQAAARLIWWSVGVWLATRALDVVVTVATVPGGAIQRVAAWNFWDGPWYEFLTRHGYSAPVIELSAYFPLYPLLTRTLLAAHMPWDAAALLVANASLLLALIFIGLLVWRETGRESIAIWAMLAIALSPLGVFLSAMYTDSLFLALAAGALLASRSGHWRWAGIALALAMVTRPFGVALALALVVEFLWQRRAWQGAWRDNLRLMLWLICPSLVTSGIFIETLWLAYGTPFIIFRAESQVFSHALRWPWQSLDLAFQQLAAAPMFSYAQLHITLDLAPVLICLIVATAYARRWPPSFTVLMFAVVALCLISPIIYPHGPQDALASDGRYCYAAVPVVIPIARWLARIPHLAGAIPLILSLCGQLALTALVLHGWWLV